MSEPRTPAAPAAPAAPAGGPVETGTAPAEAPEQPVVAVHRPSVLRVVRDQRKIVLVALVLMVACFWVMGPLGRWQAATLTAVGIALALLNHLVTELWLARLISSGAQPTRGQIATTSVLRLCVLAVVAIAVASFYWPDGVGLLLGLALFRLIALVMTGLPLLKELKAQ